MLAQGDQKKAKMEIDSSENDEPVTEAKAASSSTAVPILFEEGISPTDSAYVEVWRQAISLDVLTVAGEMFGQDAIVRDEYLEIFDKFILKRRTWVTAVSGTAGIGKSTFAVYVVARLRNDPKIKKIVIVKQKRTGTELTVIVLTCVNGVYDGQILDAYMRLKKEFMMEQELEEADFVSVAGARIRVSSIHFYSWFYFVGLGGHFSCV